MTRIPNRRASAVLFAALFLGVAWAASSWAQPTAKLPAGHPAAGTHLPYATTDLKGVMDALNAPLYTRLKAALKERPASENAWAEVERDAWVAAEIPNLLALRKLPSGMMPGVQEHGLRMQHAGVHLATAAHLKDYDQTLDAFRSLVQTCNGCHQALSPNRAPTLKP